MAKAKLAKTRDKIHSDLNKLLIIVGRGFPCKEKWERRRRRTTKKKTKRGRALHLSFKCKSVYSLIENVSSLEDSSLILGFDFISQRKSQRRN